MATSAAARRRWLQWVERLRTNHPAQAGLLCCPALELRLHRADRAVYRCGRCGKQEALAKFKLKPCVVALRDGASPGQTQRSWF